MKTPSTEASSTSSQAKYSLGRRSMRQEMSTATVVRKVVSRTSGAESPSRPKA